MDDITLVKVIWTAGVIFTVSMLSQSVSNSPKNLKERINIAIACTLIFTPLALGVIVIYGTESY